MHELKIAAGGDMKCPGPLTDKTDKSRFCQFCQSLPGAFFYCAGRPDLALQKRITPVGTVLAAGKA